MFSVKSSRKQYTVEFIDIEDLPYIKNSVAIVDQKVKDLYGDKFISKVDSYLLIEACEENKTLDFCLRLINQLCELGVKKNTTLVAVGGGITQDITSFIASILYRGISWSFIPTTLLAQADSCIGSKTSINHNNVKNLVGSFYPPDNVWCDYKLLESLDDSDIDSGIGEMLHYFMLSDSPYLHTIDKENLKPSISESLKIKKNMIERDEFDEKERRIFNYGHTFGHAIEVISNYTVKHGLAVTLGMHLANYISYSLGLISKDCLVYLQRKIEFNLPDYKVLDIDKYMGILLKDKKNIDKKLVCILPYGVGDYRVITVSDLDSITTIVERYFHEC